MESILGHGFRCIFSSPVGWRPQGGHCQHDDMGTPGDPRLPETGPQLGVDITLAVSLRDLTEPAQKIKVVFWSLGRRAAGMTLTTGHRGAHQGACTLNRFTSALVTCH